MNLPHHRIVYNEPIIIVIYDYSETSNYNIKHQTICEQKHFQKSIETSVETNIL